MPKYRNYKFVVESFWRKKILEKQLEKVLNPIYPPTCGICGKLDSNFLCKRCEKLLEGQAKFGIVENKYNENFFDKHLYIFDYQGIIRKLIIDYKFNEKTYLYKTFVNFLLKDKKFFNILKSYDTIIPVPISKKRKKERGYNQCLLISKEISKRLDIENNINCLYKVKDIVAQSTLNKEEREQNIKGAYEIKNVKAIENRRILLIDDIYTTGSTLNECSKILKKATPKNITCLTIAKD